MRSALALAAAAICTALSAGSASAQDARAVRAMEREYAAGILGRCGNPCVVRACPGGLEPHHVFVGRAVRAGRLPRIEVAGTWSSACVALAAAARPRICLRPGARMRVHTGWNVLTGRPQAQKLPPDLSAWVRSRGGVPARGWLTLDTSTASRFWRMCGARSMP